MDSQIVGAYCRHKVFVKVSRRNEGIGSQLFECLLEDIDKLQVLVFLTVSPGNEAAIAQYEKWGFTEREFDKVFYRETEDRYVLTRPL